MTNELIETFINALIEKTVNFSLNWETIALRMNGADLISPNFYHEFHGAYYDKSYLVHCSQGEIILMNEWSESGESGAMAYNYAMYLRADNHAEAHLLTTSDETPILDKLFNTIYYNYEPAPSSKVTEQFMLDFLNAQQDSE